MRLSDVFRFYSNAYGSSLDTKASAAAPAAAQHSFLLAVPPAANEVPALEHARVACLGLWWAGHVAASCTQCSELTSSLGWAISFAAAEQGGAVGATQPC